MLITTLIIVVTSILTAVLIEIIRTTRAYFNALKQQKLFEENISKVIQSLDADSGSIISVDTGEVRELKVSEDKKH